MPIADCIPKVGELVAGKYLIERELGRGGMGVVVAARQTALRRRVAIKFLLAEATSIPGASERFLREARAASAIESEHVARVFDVGSLDIGAPFMVMEYLTGSDLHSVVRARGALPIAEAVDYILQTCEAMAEAHSLGIVHRDLKPGNLFLVTRNHSPLLLKVLDFGLSKLAVTAGAGVTGRLDSTQTGLVMGSPHYMSPEQLRGLKHVDGRTDVWALGVILYQTITGTRPFDGSTLADIVTTILQDQPIPLRVRQPMIPAALELLVLRCLEKNVDRRMQTISELARGLEPFRPYRSSRPGDSGDFHTDEPTTLFRRAARRRNAGCSRWDVGSFAFGAAAATIVALGGRCTTQSPSNRIGASSAIGSLYAESLALRMAETTSPQSAPTPAQGEAVKNEGIKKQAVPESKLPRRNAPKSPTQKPAKDPWGI